MSRWRCPGCGYVYDEEAGHPREGFPPGTPWSEVPDDWACPDCGVRDKVDFEPDEERRVTASAATMGATMASTRTPYPEAARELLRQTLFGAARDQLEQRAWSEITMSDIAASRRRQPPDPLQGVRQPQRVRPRLRDPRGRALPRRRRGGRQASTSTIPAPRSAPPWSCSCAPPARTR